MGALPKRKISKARKGKRRAHSQLSLPALIKCPRCHELKFPHYACPNCGNYRGREVIEFEDKKGK
jgi:large subunit ribosomal protein L32